ncbi:MAG TPA: purine-nucleoside phosphorylase [Thermotogota bacterium]|nr:purine-nucleoside phosphorylase [Thermotogota bacterium]HRW91581.1 purine-nucleoside phosphorylase [Thermotogota bacterium]
MKKLNEKCLESKQAIQKELGQVPPVDLALVLGSGLGFLAEQLEERKVVPYTSIPHFLQSTAIGHAGNLVFGKLAGKDVAIMQGRFHAYEGYPLAQTVYPVYFLQSLGARGLLATNAAGGINLEFQSGELVAIEDVINFSGQNPLIGPNDDAVGPRFPDMSCVLDPGWFARAQAKWKEKNRVLKKGVYIFCLGPSYETPAEIRAFRQLGADMVGMSTVPEMIAARHCGLQIFGISCVTNMAAGVVDQELSHQEVMDTANRVKNTFASLVKTVVEAFE